MAKWLLILGALALLLWVLLRRSGSTKGQIEEAFTELPGGLLPGSELQRLPLRLNLGQGLQELDFLYARLDDGEGGKEGRRPLLLVHGTPGTLRSWARLALVPGGLRERFPGHPIYAVELLGHGLAAGDVRPLTFQLCADHLRAGLEALGLENALVVGHSYGGEVAMRLALDIPERLAGLVLVDSAGLARRPEEFLPEEVKLREWSLAGWGYLLNSRQRVASAFAPHFSATPPAELVDEGYLTLDHAGNWGAMVDLCRDENGGRQSELGALQVPTLLLWGSRDLAYPVERFGQAFLNALPQARLEVLEGTGHYPMEEQPKEFTSSLARFEAELP